MVALESYYRIMVKKSQSTLEFSSDYDCYILVGLRTHG
jgi:hypothetical protein